MATCLYCKKTAPEDSPSGKCSHCGMPLPEVDLRDRKRLKKPFLWFFFFVVAFCFYMMWYLPRSIP